MKNAINWNVTSIIGVMSISEMIVLCGFVRRMGKLSQTEIQGYCGF
jgi:hypothetical protein